MKSSLYDLHLAPMKKLADNKGAELLPISVTGGISAGRGVVSMRVVWLNLNCGLSATIAWEGTIPSDKTHLGCLPAILTVDSQDHKVRGRLN